MQIDFHHAVTYAVARIAGFSHAQANVIAYSAQYVDDATNSGTIKFDNGALYTRISSAHKMLDYRNAKELKNHQVWIPFHFLPGNGGMAAGDNPSGSFVRKIQCSPDSPVARDMVAACIADRGKPYGLHRLGITMHVYADTYAHQGFAGINHRINEVRRITSNNKSLDKRWFNKIANYFLSESFPLGHGAALSHPDRPSLIWEYTNGLNRKVRRDNQQIFMQAVDHMCRAMQCFIARDANMDLESAPGLPDADARKIRSLIRGVKGESGETRHQRWLQEVRSGSFSFGPESIDYIAKGRGSWKHKSIGQLAAADSGHEVFRFHPSFMKSNWKHFHDALQIHRLEILHDVLPRYGICAA